ncbi:MPN domain-containing protein, partial [Haematococcus lacustris]
MTEESRESTSGLEFKLHPLVLINMSDHYTRTKVNTGNPATKVMGILLGSQAGRTVDISNSFEMKYELTAEGGVQIDSAFLLKKQEQYKQVFSKLDVVGWYTTGQELGPQEMEVNKL